MHSEKSTMIRVISFGIFIFIINNIQFVYTTGISSNVDFESDEDTKDLGTAKKNLTAILDLNGVSVNSNNEAPVRTNPGINVKGSRGRAFFGNNRGIKRGRQIPFVKNYPTSKPSVINNIQIVVNNNETEVAKNEDYSCTGENICNVSVSTKSDSQGNLVTNVHVKLVRKLNKKPLNVEEVPVITGYRGTSARRGMQTPRFHGLNKPPAPQFIRTYNPQVHVHEAENYGNLQTMRRFLISPDSHGYYSNNNDKVTPKMNFVDDKIEAPLSKTTATENSGA